MCEQPEDGRDGGAAKGDNVQEKSVGDPFDDDGWDLGEGDVVAEQRIRVCAWEEGARCIRLRQFEI